MRRPRGLRTQRAAAPLRVHRAVSILAGKHPLRPGLTAARARDVLLVLTGPHLFVQYTRELAWSAEELAAWITAAVLEQVFGLR